MPHDLDHGSLQALLETLGREPGEAGLAYEHLRLRLIRFFHWNHCSAPEDLADVALDRLAGKIMGNAEPIRDPEKYAAGIARMLLHEENAQEIRRQKMLSGFSAIHSSSSERDDGLQLREEALSHCLDRLTGENRRLLERYYMGDAGGRIRARQSLAAELGIGLNALRNRALRLRRQLEECMARRPARAAGHDGSHSILTPRDGSSS